MYLVVAAIAVIFFFVKPEDLELSALFAMSWLLSIWCSGLAFSSSAGCL